MILTAQVRPEKRQVILSRVRYASERLGKLRLLVFGRHAELSKAAFGEGLRGLRVELSVEGVSAAQIIVERLHGLRAGSPRVCHWHLHGNKRKV